MIQKKLNDRGIIMVTILNVVIVVAILLFAGLAYYVMIAKD